MSKNEIHVSVKLLDPEGAAHDIAIPEDAPLLEVLQFGAVALGVQLLPTPGAPLDRLHNIGKHHQVGPPIETLDQALGDFLDQNREATRDFGIELSLVIRVNTRWDIATSATMTPREILALPRIALDFQQYTLYLPGSAEPLPLDGPLTITRGEAFEAQRDGKYGTA